MQDEQPVAYDYELADARDGHGQYCEWRSWLTRHKPNVPEGSIRNLRALYAREAGEVAP